MFYVNRLRIVIDVEKIIEEIRGCCEKRTMLNMKKISSVFLTYLIILTANSLLLPVAGG